MKSLHLVKTSTGATWAFRVMRDLVQMGEEVHVAMPVDGILVQQYKDAGIHIHELNYSVKNVWGTIKQICKVVDEVKPDIVHSHFVVTTLLMRLALRNYRVARVFEVPGPLHLEHTIIVRQTCGQPKRRKTSGFLPAGGRWINTRSAVLMTAVCFLLIMVVTLWIESTRRACSVRNLV